MFSFFFFFSLPDETVALQSRTTRIRAARPRSSSLGFYRFVWARWLRDSNGEERRRSKIMAHARNGRFEDSSARILSPRRYFSFFFLSLFFDRSIGQNSPDFFSLPSMLITRLVHASFVRESAVNYSTATQQQQRAGLKWRSV